MPNRYSDRPYTVGKGKPPVHTQFGQNGRGNPNGRPRGAVNTRTLVDDALSARLTVKEGGRERRITKRQALITQLTNKAVGGDLRAIEMVLRMMRDSDAAAPTERQDRPLSSMDRAVLEQFAESLRGGAPNDGQ